MYFHQNSQDPTTTKVSFTLCNESDHYYKSHYCKKRQGCASIMGHACQALGKAGSEPLASRCFLDTVIISSIYRGKVNLQWVEHMSSVTHLGRPWTRTQTQVRPAPKSVHVRACFTVPTSRHNCKVSREEVRRQGGREEARRSREVTEGTYPNSLRKVKQSADFPNSWKQSHETLFLN